MDYKISVIIRTYNEEKHIKDVLEAIKKQTYKNYEIIMVDSESTDSTLEIAKDFNVSIVKIYKKDFNYSYASNIGADNATGNILCYLSGHSVPCNPDYFQKINEAFQDKAVGGVYGEVIALRDGSVWEKTFHYLGYLKSKEIEKEYEIHPGILSCSNACIRKDIWEKHRFKDKLGKGGEDVEMAYRILKDGYYILKLKKALVRHSHGSSLKKFIAEFKSWKIQYENVLSYIKENP